MTDSDKSFHIILYQPEIPNNTGNIGRTCVATNCHLHLIGPLGFDIGEKSVRRAGLDYWQYLTLTYHENYESFCTAEHGIQRLFYFSTKATQNYSDVKYQRGDGLMFGPETRGLPETFWKDRSAQCFKIPMIGPTRSLNLSNAVSIVSYEGLRQLGTQI